MSQSLSGQVSPVPPEPPARERSSLFVSGVFPRHRGRLLALSAVAGVLLAYVWSAEFVDNQIGSRAADAILGHDAAATPIAGLLSGTVFAFVTGLAGTFTACNIAVFGAVGPLVGQEQDGPGRLRRTLAPIGWIAAGMIPVSALYGVLVGVMGTHMPQFSLTREPGLQPRIVQAMVVFGIIGLVMIVLGLAAAGLVPDPLAGVSRRFPQAPLVLMGVLIGAFLIGRPYPLFRQLFHDAAEKRNPLYGATAFTLQSLGNILIMAVLVLALAYLTGERLQRALARNPSRVAAVTAGAFLVAGVFMVVYWDLRILGRFDYIWFPTAPWN
ncbi:hypothetical protein [Kineosporia succinea]|uniref:Cytochrome C biogenesis protein transmembrane region n=1 Tax=Kineosporia succinea TaxID=84632 RepID=A0ABT9PAK5_9ACTN|nr:hypothetical protein [Kineosporia succinea]MDP9829723.1 hypothetical protein [Kineosporia succinea]